MVKKSSKAAKKISTLPGEMARLLFASDRIFSPLSLATADDHGYYFELPVFCLLRFIFH
jgi:hypothetical protein